MIHNNFKNYIFKFEKINKVNYKYNNWIKEGDNKNK